MTSAATGPYVDLQVNGFMGIDFNDPQLPLHEIERAALAMREGAVETALATIITAPLPDMIRCLSNLRTAIETLPAVRQTISGIHIEGPFISPVKGYVGAHPVDSVLGDDVDSLDRLLDAGGPFVRLVTIAPEIDPQSRLVKRLVNQNILVAAGHTDATVPEIQRAIDSGLQLFTHVGNACPQLMHRHDNVFQRALSLAPQLKYTFIADGWHLPSFVVRNLIRLASLEHLAVVSDAIAAAGLGPGEYQLGPRRVRIGADRCARSPDGEHFVGAASTMADADRWLAADVGLDSQQRHKVLYENPRRWLDSAS